MRIRYRQRPPSKKESATAVAAAMTVAAGVGAVVFYIARALLARDRITPPALAETDDEAQE